ncbi:MAG: DUF6715 family protein [Lachnospiraceae bacterium]
MVRANMRSGTKSKASKTNDKHAALRSGIVILLLVAMMVGYYYYLSNRQKQNEPAVVTLTVAQELITRDLKNNYPPTPKEVIRYYSDITKCFYNEEYSDEELEQLAGQTRLLYDEELISNNDWGKYIIELKNDIDYYKDNSIRISSYSIPASTDVDYFSDDGYDFARLHCTYVLVSNGVKQPVEEVYLLRKDEAGHWRIFGWDLAENVTLEE